MKKKVNHTGIRNSKLFCFHCGGEFNIPFPIAAEMLASITDGFNKMHKDCNPGWKEPEANPTKSIYERAMWWRNYGETGASSKTMWNCFMQTPGKFEINHPYDPDDFKRCYKLLQAIPEWKNEMHRLKQLSSAWDKLVDNWDKLTEMYEENIRTEWKNYKKIGMYDFMKTLIQDNPNPQT
jgi:hypothetical protein